LAKAFVVAENYESSKDQDMSLKASELRIGNWVHSPHSKYTWQVYPDDFREIWDHPENYEPIPLSEEWLVKFGFEKHFEDEYWYDIPWKEEGPYGKVNVFLEGGFCYVHSGLAADGEDYGFKVICKYVHTLQNLIHGLTGEELTINQI
jgi:hypothetical protein